MSGILFGTADGVAKVIPIDYAGGTVVHINAGAAGLVLALIVGQRAGFKTQRMPPHKPTLTMVGAGLLWVGWLGSNVGSMNRYGLSETEIADFLSQSGVVWLNTVLAACVGMLGWLLAEKLRTSVRTPAGVPGRSRVRNTVRPPSADSSVCAPQIDPSAFPNRRQPLSSLTS
ncbi:MAG: hypothetical protein ACRCYU_21190 [Nocardioides sp.]